MSLPLALVVDSVFWIILFPATIRYHIEKDQLTLVSACTRPPYLLVDLGFCENNFFDMDCTTDVVAMPRFEKREEIAEKEARTFVFICSARLPTHPSSMGWRFNPRSTRTEPQPHATQTTPEAPLLSSEDSSDPPLVSVLLAAGACDSACGEPGRCLRGVCPQQHGGRVCTPIHPSPHPSDGNNSHPPGSCLLGAQRFPCFRCCYRLLWLSAYVASQWLLHHAFHTR